MGTQPWDREETAGEFNQGGGKNGGVPNGLRKYLPSSTPTRIVEVSK